MLRQMKYALVAGCLALTALAKASPTLSPAANDPRAIMQAVSEHSYGRRASSVMKMTIRDASGVRERIALTRSLGFAGGRKSLIVIESPADVRNTGFLSVDYQHGTQTDEQWLYLPKLRRVTRVPPSGKSDAFVGSDFTYSDLSQQDPDDYDFKLVQPSVKVGDEECWVIAGTPRTETVKAQTGYSQTELWVSKSKLAIVQLKATLVKDNKTKYFKASDFRQIDGIWTAHRLQMRTLQAAAPQSETLIEISAVKNNAPEVSDSDFTQQRLERGL